MPVESQSGGCRKLNLHPGVRAENVHVVYSDRQARGCSLPEKETEQNN